MTAVPSNAAVVPGSPRHDGDNSSAAARICWHTIAICHALDRGVGELQLALAEAGEHADQILELVLGLAGGESDVATPTVAGEW